ncbi:PLP-dependent transferase [Trametopsis cervina]|nr:PLP-dependent transferase [Trametopsis cervina]
MLARIVSPSHFALASRSLPLLTRTTIKQNAAIALPEHLSVLKRKMSTFKQENHKLLVIPGPIEVTDEVLYANATPPLGHTSADFIPYFGESIRMTREVVYTTTGQPFLIAGSGTLGWDQVAANLIEPGESVLLLNSGYFGDSFADCLRAYGADVDEVRADFGKSATQAELEAALSTGKKYKAVAFTHVDTSTAVLADAKMISETVKRLSPESLVFLDGVCSVASEEIRMDDWGVDVVIGASQKGLGAPPGLSIVIASQKAIQTMESRKTPITGFYTSWKRWLPIMKAYEAGNPAYFATPPVNLIRAYHTSLKQITQSGVSLQERFKLHIEAAQRIRQAAVGLGLRLVPVDPHNTANGLSAIYLPEGLGVADLVPRMIKRQIVITGGIHKDNKDKYFRIGHMGTSVVDKQRGDIDKVITALKESLEEALASKKA